MIFRSFGGLKITFERFLCEGLQFLETVMCHVSDEHLCPKRSSFCNELKFSSIKSFWDKKKKSFLGQNILSPKVFSLVVHRTLSICL